MKKAWMYEVGLKHYSGWDNRNQQAYLSHDYTYVKRQELNLFHKNKKVRVYKCSICDDIIYFRIGYGITYSYKTCEETVMEKVLK